MRLIDADALLKKQTTIRVTYHCQGADEWDDYEAVLVKDINNAPTISPDEVRGVVHCRECDLWNRWDSAGRESLGNLTCSCAHWTVEDGAVIHTKPTDFCSYGERMVSEDA